jgi:hypothetical protein
MTPSALLYSGYCIEIPARGRRLGGCDHDLAELSELHHCGSPSRQTLAHGILPLPRSQRMLPTHASDYYLRQAESRFQSADLSEDMDRHLLKLQFGILSIAVTVRYDDHRQK